MYVHIYTILVCLYYIIQYIPCTACYILYPGTTTVRVSFSYKSKFVNEKTFMVKMSFPCHCF